MRTLIAGSFIALAFATSGCKKLVELALEEPKDAAVAPPKVVTFKSVRLTVPGDSTIKESDVNLDVTRPVRPGGWPQMDSLGIAEESELTFNARVHKSAAHVVTPHGEFWYSPLGGINGQQSIAAEMQVGRDIYLYVNCTASAVNDVPTSLEDWCFPIMRTIRPR